jgi:acyl carrier protein
LITIEEIEQLIREEMGARLDGVQITGDTRLKDLDLSSLQLSELVFTLEERHSVEFDPAKAAEIVTLQDIVALGSTASDRATTTR